MPYLTRFRATGAALTAAAMTLGGFALAPTAAQAAQRAAIAGTHPAWAVPAHRVGTAAVTAGTVNARVYLAGRDQAGLTAFATAVSTPGNALYGHYLTAAQVQSRYGPTSAQIAAVESWVRSAGLTVTGVDSQMAGYVSVTGSVTDARQAFGVGFGTFKAPNGGAYRAPTEAATAPGSVSGDVLAVSGLDTAPHLMKPEQLPPPGPNYWVAPPCSAYYGQKIATTEPTAFGKHQPWNNCGYTQRQIRDGYGVTSSGMTGQGQTVAIVDAYASPTMHADANEFATVTGDKPFRPGQYAQHLDTPFTETAADECDAAGWYGEESLDVEAVHGQAPNANVRFVAAASCEDSDLANADAYIVNHHLASIVSNSWGEPADDAVITNVFDLIFQAGAAEGIGFFFSSGDSGYESPAEDSGSDQIQVDYPTSSPWVTSVGGTSLAIGKRGNYEFETSWGTLLDPLASNGTSWSATPPGEYPAGYDGSSGGGVSTAYQQPFYQARAVPAALSHRLPNGTVSPTAMRVVPDVSALADPSTGMLVGETILEPNGKTFGFALSRIGGTSVASPTFAGIEADAQQAAGRPLGFADPAIYARYGTAAFRDVTDHPLGPGYLAQVRNNYTNPATKAGPILTYLRTLGIDGEGAAALPATRGYDDATGVGSPRNYIQSFARR
ncbi:MAG TPA: S53 family peptidase [Streptosporangiaceae bacterium]|nr:S53 family peptidase [Streptosporangiaceae bacterium]